MLLDELDFGVDDVAGLLERQIKAVSADLIRLGVDSALVGGLAVSSRTIPRMTKDIDVCVAVIADAEAETLVRTLLKDGYQLVTTLEHRSSGRLATVRLALPGSDSITPEIDLMFSSCGIEPEIVAQAETITVLGIPIKVAITGHLIAMKLLSERDTRPTDRADLYNLFKIATPSDLKQANAALSLIHKRGFSRGKDLMRTFKEYLGTIA